MNIQTREKQMTWKRITDELIDWMRKWFEENGPDCKAVIGISGGKDSSIAAALCVKALGKDRVFGVLMPQGTQSDIQMSYDLCKELDIDYIEVNILNACRNIKHQIRDQIGAWSAQSSINLPPRIRMSVLYAVSQNINGRVINTSNFSEDYVGYATRYGDTAGDVAPLARFLVCEVKEIGYALGLPAHFIEKTPFDGLCGKTDEENLGFSYDEFDRWFLGTEARPYVNIDAVSPTKESHILELHQKNMFKFQELPAMPFRKPVYSYDNYLKAGNTKPGV